MSSSNRDDDLLDVLVRVLHVAKLTYAIGDPFRELGGHVRDDGVEVVERVLLLEEGPHEALEHLVRDELLVVHRLELVLELLALALVFLFFLSSAIVVVVVALVEVDVLALVAFVDLVVDVVDLAGAFFRGRL